MPRKKAAPKTRKRKQPEENDEEAMQAEEEPTQPTKKQKLSLGKPPKFTKTRLKAYFQKYKDDEDQVNPEGMGRLCEDAQVDPEDVAMLVLAWKMDAKRMGYFSEEEFMQGFEKLKIDCPEALHGIMDSLRAELPKVRSEVFKFAFDFGKDSADKKTLELDIVQTSYRGMSADHWKMWYEFAHSVGPDFKEYDVMAAWPSIIDEYVEHYQKEAQ